MPAERHQLGYVCTAPSGEEYGPYPFNDTQLRTHMPAVPAEHIDEANATRMCDIWNRIGRGSYDYRVCGLLGTH